MVLCLFLVHLVSAGPIAEAAVTGKVPGLAGPLAALRFGMTEAEQRRLTPSLRSREGDVKLYFGGLVPDEHGSSTHDPDRRVLDRVLLTFPRGRASELAEKAWGKPLVKQRNGKPVHFWFDPKAKIRAMLILDHFFPDDSIQLEPYSTLGDLFAGKGLPFAFEKVPVIGKSRAELRAAFGDALRESDHSQFALLQLPVAELADGIRVELKIRDGKVSGYELTLGAFRGGYTDAELLRALEGKFGKASVVREESSSPEGATRVTFPGVPSVTVRQVREQWIVSVSSHP
jgi:hypothetical protein